MRYKPTRAIKKYLETLIRQQSVEFSEARDLKLLKEMELAANMGFDVDRYRHIYQRVKETYEAFEKLKNNENKGIEGYQANSKEE